uniref:Uncharacterized protein n=1 Tax=Opuntia streptacantha TaxID=393608 RepID=A0A7C9E5B6_OPUST
MPISPLRIVFQSLHEMVAYLRGIKLKHSDQRKSEDLVMNNVRFLLPVLSSGPHEQHQRGAAQNVIYVYNNQGSHSKAAEKIEDAAELDYVEQLVDLFMQIYGQFSC